MPNTHSRCNTLIPRQPESNTRFATQLPVEVELPVVLLPVDTSVHMPLYSHDIQHFAGPMEGTEKPLY